MPLLLLLVAGLHSEPLKSLPLLLVGLRWGPSLPFLLVVRLRLVPSLQLLLLVVRLRWMPLLPLLLLLEVVRLRMVPYLLPLVMVRLRWVSPLLLPKLLIHHLKHCSISSCSGDRTSWYDGSSPF